MKNKSIKILVAIFIPLGIGGFTPLSALSTQPQSGDCECEPSIDGEATDGGNASQSFSPDPGFDINGKATIINEGELPGTCDLGPESACNTAETCSFYLKLSASIISLSHPSNLDPADLRVGPFTIPLTGNSTSGWTGTSTTKRYDDLFCEFFQAVKMKIRDSAGTVVARANLTLRCADCPEASGS